MTYIPTTTVKRNLPTTSTSRIAKYSNYLPTTTMNRNPPTTSMDRIAQYSTYLLTTTEKENIPAASTYRLTRYSVYLPTKKNLPTTGQSDYNFNPNGRKSFQEFWLSGRNTNGVIFNTDKFPVKISKGLHKIGNMSHIPRKIRRNLSEIITTIPRSYELKKNLTSEIQWTTIISNKAK